MGCVYRAKTKKNDRLCFIKYRTDDGKWKVESAKTESVAEAKKLLAKREADVADGKPIVDAGRKNAYTLEAGTAALVADWTVRGRKPRSIAQMQGSVENHLAKFFGLATRLSAITRDRIDAYALARKTAGVKLATVRRELSFLSRMFTLGIEARRVHYRPAFPQIPTRQNARKGFFEDADFAKFVDALPPYLADLATLGYWTGWRMQAELAPLDWYQIDLVAQTIRLEKEQSKNGDGRLYPYANVPEVAAAIGRCAARRERLKARGVIVSKLLTDPNGVELVTVYEKWGSCYKPFVADAWKAAGAKSGVERLRHDLRRTTVRNLTRRGVPEKIAMTITGHKTREVFDRYDIVNEADLSAALGRFAAPAAAPKRRRQKVA
jgi:hypothetical protein